MPAAVKPLPKKDLAHGLDYTREHLPEAKSRAFFITGVTGFFGMWLLASFAYINDTLGLDMRATVLTRDPLAFALKAPHLTARVDLTFILGDVRFFEFLPSRFDYVIHAATEASAKLNEVDPQEMLDAIIGGIRRVLDFTAQAGVKKLLLTTYGAVYGKQPVEITHVSKDYLGAPDPLLHGSAYGEGKRVSEHMCVVRARQHGYEVKIARCFAFVGPHLPLDTHFAIGNFIRDAMRGGVINVAGDGTPYRSYFYCSELAVWIWKILSLGASGRAYNVGSAVDKPLSLTAQTVGRIVRLNTTVSIALAPVDGRPVARCVPSVDRAAVEFGLRQQVDLEESLPRAFGWVNLDFSRGPLA